MKKIILSAAMLIGSLTAFSQANALDLLFEKYEGKPGFTSVNVSEKLFALAASAMPVDEAEIKGLVDGIKSVKILVFENTEGNARSIEYFKEAQAALPNAGYEELMTVQSDGEKVIMLGKTSSESVLEDLIMIVLDETEFVLIKIVGTIDMKNISKFSEMGLDHLDQLNIEIEKSEE